VDDEDSIRAPLAEFLRIQGFTVLEARNGAEALEHAKAYAGPIHALVTDVVMPRMGGKSLADALRAVRPEMRVLYLSGHSESTVARRGQIDPGVAILQKPFPPAALVGRILDLLADARPDD
jgi:DNA-binding response OmpR family regulator